MVLDGFGRLRTSSNNFENKFVAGNCGRNGGSKSTCLHAAATSGCTNLVRLILDRIGVELIGEHDDLERAARGDRSKTGL